MDTYGSLYDSATDATVDAPDDLTPTYTLSEADKLLNTDLARLAAAETALEKARQDYARNVDNHPLAQGPNGDKIRQELATRFRPALEAAEQEAVNVSESVHANARAIYEQTNRSQYALTDDELRAADARRSFIREDCESEPFASLVDAVRYAILKEDRPALYCYARYVPNRLALGDRGADGEWRDSAAIREKSELRRLLQVVDGKLKDQTLAPVNTRAGELLTRAGQVRSIAWQGQQRQHRYAFEGEHDVPWETE